MNYDLMIDNPYIIENENFCIYASPSLKKLADASFNELKLNMKRILYFFELDDFRKVIVILFDDRVVFRKFVLSLREPGAHLPEYAHGVFDKGMIISFINQENIKSQNELSDKAKINVHEFIHIVNKEKVYKKRVVWLDEGVASYLDGERDYLKENDKFNNFLNTKILNIKNLPAMNDLSHKGSGFKQDLYNGYDLAYLCVRYLVETYNKDKFIQILRDYDLSIEIGKTILQDAIDYYSFPINDLDKSISGNNAPNNTNK